MSGMKSAFFRTSVMLVLLLTVSTAFSAPPVPSKPALALQVPKKGGPHYKLPLTATPTDYELQLKLNLPDTFDGIAKIVFVALLPVSFITLHADQEVLTINHISIANASMQVTGWEMNSELQMMTIHLNQPLQQSKSYQMEITYNGKLRKDMYGFYRSSFNTSSMETRWLAATQFEPAYARSAFPCWDEPQYKAQYKVSIIHGSELTALSNMDEFNRLDIGGGKVVTTFNKSPPMSSYLVAFVVSDFGSQDDTANKPPFRVFMRKEQVSQAEYAKQVGPKTLRKLEEYTGVKFELPKLDLVAIPDFSAGAMENWGLITFRETGLMYAPGESTEAAKESIGLVIAHEEAHMWFGDLVSPAWWCYTWLNEGFARYFQYVSLNEVEKDWNLMDSFVVNTMQSVMGTDALESTHPMTSDVYTPAEIQGVFDKISYDKGASVLHMTRNFLGEVAFKTGINKYLKKMAHAVATPQDLFSALNASAIPGTLPKNGTLEEILTTWTTQPGFPVITITTNSSSGKATVSQARYIATSGPDTSATSPRWWVPLTITTESDTDFNATDKVMWLNPDQHHTTINISTDGWIIANLQETGFYRVNYDVDNWKKISKYLRSENHTNIHILNKAQILDDALTLARSGTLEYPIALSLTKYLANETHPIPWRTALEHFNFLNNMLKNSTAQDETLKEYIKNVTANVYNTIGFEENQKESHLTKTFRSTILSWACNLGNENCVQTAFEKFKKMKQDKEKLNPDVRSAVYCTALRTSNSTCDWDFLWERYRHASTVPGERAVILGSLGCTQNETLLNRYLNRSLDETAVRPQDAQAVFTSVLNGNPANVKIAFDFFQARFKEIAESYGGWSSMQNVITGIAGKLTTEEELKQLETFLQGHQNELGIALPAAKRALESANGNMKWRRKYKDNVTHWLKSGSPVFALHWGLVALCAVLAVWRL